MYSKKDFEYKQILLINTLEKGVGDLSFGNENVVFKKDGKIVNQMSCHRLWAVLILGDITLTSKLIQRAKKLGVSLILMNRNFEVYAEINAEAKGNYLLRAHQYSLTPEQELELSKELMVNKISNQLQLIYNKLSPKDALSKQKFKDSVSKAKKEILGAKDNAALLAVEGFYAKTYYGQLFEEVGWRRRAARTKEDVPNLLLDIGYTFLFNLTNTLLSLHGFDTYKGFYHKLFFQRKSLACDLMEPFRPLIDWHLLKAYRLGQVAEKDFGFAKGSYRLSYKNSSRYTSIFLRALLENKMKLFDYVRQFYYFQMDKPEVGFPKYKLNIR